MHRDRRASSSAWHRTEEQYECHKCRHAARSTTGHFLLRAHARPCPFVADVFLKLNNTEAEDRA